MGHCIYWGVTCHNFQTKLNFFCSEDWRCLSNQCKPWWTAALCTSGSIRRCKWGQTIPTRLLTFCIWKTHKQVLWQTVKTQIKCHILWHFIRFYTVCFGKDNLQGRQMKEFIKCGELKLKIFMVLIWEAISKFYLYLVFETHTRICKKLSKAIQSIFCHKGSFLPVHSKCLSFLMMKTCIHLPILSSKVKKALKLSKQ